MNNKPFVVTEKEIKELAEVREIQELWGSENAVEMAEILHDLYTARFDFINESPGYVGDLFIIQPACLAGETPAMRVVRGRNRELEIVD